MRAHVLLTLLVFPSPVFPWGWVVVRTPTVFSPLRGSEMNEDAAIATICDVMETQDIGEASSGAKAPTARIRKRDRAGRLLHHAYLSLKPGVPDATVLFPTLAYRDHDDPQHWRIQLHGWIYRPRDLGVKRVFSVAGLVRLYRVRPDEYDVFLRRIGPFIVRNRCHRSVTLQCCSATTGEGESSDCGLAHISSTSSDKYGHFKREEVIHECELPGGLPELGTPGAQVWLF